MPTYDIRWAWGIYSFLLPFFGFSVFFSWKQEKRKYWWIVLIGLAVVVVGLSFLLEMMTYYIRVNTPSFQDNVPVSFIMLLPFVIYYVVSVICLLGMFKNSIWAALFFATLSYCLQHISERCYELLTLGIYGKTLNVPMGYWIPVLIAFTLVFYFLFYFLALNKVDVRSFGKLVDYKLQILAMVFVILVAIYFNSQITFISYDSKNWLPIQTLSYITSVLFATVVVLMEMTLVQAKIKEKEADRLNRLLEGEKTKYESEKKAIDLLNVRYHDIKHMLNDLQENKDSESDKAVIKEIQKNLTTFQESTVQTGNEALDILLYQKEEACRKKDIRFTCMLSGVNLSYFQPYELYALFENALDNAIQGVKDLPIEKRVIDINQNEVNGFEVIKVSNYFQGNLVFEKGLPQTRKDPSVHGFGMKSMRAIAEKYDGRVSASCQDDLFVLTIFLPLAKPAEK
jgi:hypothetical protein